MDSNYRHYGWNVPAVKLAELSKCPDSYFADTANSLSIRKLISMSL
jgi:hypothetical protein